MTTHNDIPHITEGDVACSCNPLVLTIAPDGSISRIAGGPLEEPISTAAPDPVASPEVQALWQDYRHVTKTGNPLGMSFAHYIAARVGKPPPVTSTSTTLRLDPVASPAPLDVERLATVQHARHRLAGSPAAARLARSPASAMECCGLWAEQVAAEYARLEGQPVAEEPAE